MFYLRVVVALAGLMIFGFGSGYTQETLRLSNPSFEDIPRAGGLGAFYLPIRGWVDCARSVYPGQTPPDIHPHAEAWMVTLVPADGSTYLGMVVREDETHEFLSQALSSEMIGGQCYTFSVALAQSDTYMGQRTVIEDTFSYERPFLEPSVLRVWGGSSLCSKDQLLAESPPVTNDTWKRFEFKLEPTRSYRFLILEAFYQTPVLVPYNGHILVDDCSDLVPIPCEEQVPLEPEPEPEVFEPIVVMAPARQTESTRPKVEEIEKDEPATIVKGEILSELDRQKLQKGQTIQIRNLYFPADSADIVPESYKVLDEIANFLIHNSDVIIEVGGHTATVPPEFYCDSLSTARAKAVNDYLVNKGVPEDQLEYKGYGKRQPLIKDDSKSFAARRKNQRVEIKVLSLDGDD